MRELILPLTVLNLLNYLTRYLPAAVLPTLSAELGFSYEQSGLLIAAFFAGYVCFTPVAGYWGDRRSRPHLMMAGILLWGFATLLLGWAPGLGILLVARFLTGAGEAGYATLAPTYIKDKLGDAVQVSRAFSVFFVAIPVGSALGFVLGGQLSGVMGWRYAFSLCALPSLLLAAWMLRFSDPPRQLPSGEIADSLKRIFQSKLYRYLIAGYVFNSFALNAVAAFVTTHGVELGFSNESIAAYFGGILVVSGFSGTYFGGMLASRWALRAPLPNRFLLSYVAFGSGLAAPVLAAAFLTSDRTLFLALAFVAEFLVFAGVAPLNTLVVEASPKTDLSTSQSLCILSINLFGALPAPWLVGAVADRTFLACALQLAPIAMLISGIVWHVGVRRCFERV